MEHVLRTWQGDDGKEIREIKRDGEKVFRLSYPPKAEISAYYLENNLQALQTLAEHELPGPRLIAQDTEQGWIDTTYCGEPLEDLIVAAATDPERLHVLELVRDAARLLFTYAAAGEELRPVEPPVPLKNAERMFDETIHQHASAQAEDVVRVWEHLMSEIHDLKETGPVTQGFANLDPHLLNFVVDKSDRLTMIDFDNSRLHYDPYYSASFLYFAADPMGRADATPLQRAVLAGVDWAGDRAVKRFAIGLASVRFGSLMLELNRLDLTDEQKAQICTFDLKNIFRTLEEGWVAFGQRCEEELHRPELSDICTQIGYVPFSDLRASELER